MTADKNSPPPTFLLVGLDDAGQLEVLVLEIRPPTRYQSPARAPGYASDYARIQATRVELQGSIVSRATFGAAHVVDAQDSAQVRAAIDAMLARGLDLVARSVVARITGDNGEGPVSA